MAISTRILDRYDWVVLGDDPGALLSAAVSAQLGFSVLVLPMRASLLAHISKSGQCLDPEPNSILGLGASDRGQGILSHCLQGMGIPTTNSKLFRSGESVLPQVLTPTARLSWAPRDERFVFEFQRDLGAEARRGLSALERVEGVESSIFQFWRDFPASTLERKKPNQPIYWEPGFKKTVRLSSALKAAHLTREVTEVIQGLHAAVTGTGAVDVTQKENQTRLLHLLALARVAGAFKGGVTGYRRFLIEFAKRQGARVIENVDFRRLFVENGRVIGVQTMTGGRMIGLGAGVLGCSLARARSGLSLSGRNWFHRIKKSPQIIGWKFTIALTVHAEAVPPGMGARAIWMEEGAPPLEIEVADPDDYLLGQMPHRLIFVRTVLPFDQKSLDVEYQRLIASRMFRQLSEVFPFLEYHVTKVFPDFRSGHDPEHEFSEAYGFVSPDMIPENLWVLERNGVGHRSGIDSLYVASGESYPGLGSLGSSVAGFMAVSDFVKRSGASVESRLRDLWKFT